MNNDLIRKRDSLAEKRSKRQCSTGNQNLDHAISWYLKVGFEEGFDAGVAEMQAQIARLEKAEQERDTLKAQVEELKKAKELYQFEFHKNQQMTAQLQAKDAVIDLAVKALENISAQDNDPYCHQIAEHALAKIKKIERIENNAKNVNTFKTCTDDAEILSVAIPEADIYLKLK